MLLDTNVLSELRRLASSRMDANVRAWAASIAGQPLYLSAISILEVRTGIVQAERKDPARAAFFQRWLDEQVLVDFAGRILPFDTDVALTCARLHADRTRPELDAMIAATALVHGLTLATRNTRDFAGTGVRLVDPWAYRVGSGSSPVQS